MESETGCGSVCGMLQPVAGRVEAPCKGYQALHGIGGSSNKSSASDADALGLA